MYKIRYLTKFFWAFLQKFKTVFIVSIILGLFAFFLFPRVQGILLNFIQGETIGVVGRFTTDTLPQDIQSEISVGLTTVDYAGNAGSGIAESWQPDSEGRIWVFRLGDYKWQDGTKIQAYDINYQFSDVTSEVLDNKTIKFVLKEPFSPFPAIVSRPIFKKGLLGAGTWKVVKISFATGDHVSSLKLVNINNDQVRTYKFYPTEEVARTGFKLGEVDQLKDIVDPKDIVQWKNVTVAEQKHRGRYVGIFINNQDPLLSGKNVRQALSYAVDKDKFEQELAISPLSPDSWAYNPQVKPYSYSPERAKELIKNLPEEQRKDLTVRLVTTPTLLPLADKIKEDWDAVGFDTQVQVSNSLPRDFQTLLAIQVIPSDPDQYSFWHSTQTETNITNYRNSRESQRIDKLLEDGRKTLKSDERRAIYLDFQRFLVEDSPVIFLFHPTTYTITRQ